MNGEAEVFLKYLVYKVKIKISIGTCYITSYTYNTFHDTRKKYYILTYSLLTLFLIKSQRLEKATTVPANFLSLSVKRKIYCVLCKKKKETDSLDK